MTSRTGSVRRILGDFEESEKRLDTGREGLTFACSPTPLAGVARDGVGQMKKPEQKERVSLSTYVEEPLNSKVIKCFVPELRRWKSQNRKNVYLSPYVEEPLNSKVIKSFVPEPRSRYVVF